MGLEISPNTSIVAALASWELVSPTADDTETVYVSAADPVVRTLLPLQPPTPVGASAPSRAKLPLRAATNASWDDVVQELEVALKRRAIIQQENALFQVPIITFTDMSEGVIVDAGTTMGQAQPVLSITNPDVRVRFNVTDAVDVVVPASTSPQSPPEAATLTTSVATLEKTSNAVTQVESAVQAESKEMRTMNVDRRHLALELTIELLNQRIDQLMVENRTLRCLFEFHSPKA
ncbi:hypothetical protein SeMB42_g05400 [Synchytrium endobioticum]|uniref:Uncharacterized protein n=1 Tax=Synchytrium endobioticum TaxID=286115 RepID=A0A507CRR6_9FUNG|nr:hypothetical protein SeMB42_g05400 [Synchytrium endobioticum]